MVVWFFKVFTTAETCQPFPTTYAATMCTPTDTHTLYCVHPDRHLHALLCTLHLQALLCTPRQTPTRPTVYTPPASPTVYTPTDTHTPYRVHPNHTPTPPTVYTRIRHLHALCVHPYLTPIFPTVHTQIKDPTVYTPIWHLHAVLCTPQSDTYLSYCIHPKTPTHPTVYTPPTSPTVHTPSDTYTQYCVHPNQTPTLPTAYTCIRHLHYLLCTPLSDTCTPYCAHSTATCLTVIPRHWWCWSTLKCLLVWQLVTSPCKVTVFVPVSDLSFFFILLLVFGIWSHLKVSLSLADFSWRACCIQLAGVSCVLRGFSFGRQFISLGASFIDLSFHVVHSLCEM